VPLSTDNSALVRLGVLEALGEVLFTFHQDEDGPPQELVQLFLGRKEDRRVRDGQQGLPEEEVAQARHREHILNSVFGLERPASLASPQQSTRIDKGDALESFYTDPARPLICAFNYPAVTMTLGRARWWELREVYLDLAENRAVKVRRTLAASLGELAKIIGEENASRDLVGVWWDAVRCEEEEVREKVVECIEVFVAALGCEAREEVVRGLLTVWEEGVFRGWREREGVAKAFVGLINLVGRNNTTVLRGLLRNALEDHVAAVREAAVYAVSSPMNMNNWMRLGC
jgi:serine/threonine-protein phosphatase 4 regulatory subunit 1